MDHIITKLKKDNKLNLLNEPKSDGFTALHLACLNNYLDIVNLLVKVSEVEKNFRNLNDQTPLHLAIERQNYEIIKILILNNCDLNAQDKEGDSCLHYLLRNYSVLHLKRLKDMDSSNLIKANINNYFSSVPVSYLSSIDKKSIVNIACLLIENGANLYASNKKQQTPTDLCTDSNLVRLLIRYSNDIYRSNDNNNEMNTYDTFSSSTDKDDQESRDAEHWPNISNLVNYELIKFPKIEDIKQQTMCPLCYDKFKNMIFLCGHGTCQICGESVRECPICFKEINRKILLY